MALLCAYSLVATAEEALHEWCVKHGDEEIQKSEAGLVKVVVGREGRYGTVDVQSLRVFVVSKGAFLTEEVV